MPKVKDVEALWRGQSLQNILSPKFGQPTTGEMCTISGAGWPQFAHNYLTPTRAGAMADIYAVEDSQDSAIEALKTTLEERLTRIENELFGRQHQYDAIYAQYIKLLKGSDIVSQIYAVEMHGTAVIWTVIESTPFEDELRMPIYQAQIKILSTLDEKTSVDFHIVNRLELSTGEDIDAVVPKDAKLLWTR